MSKIRIGIQEKKLKRASIYIANTGRRFEKIYALRMRAWVYVSAPFFYPSLHPGKKYIYIIIYIGDVAQAIKK